MSQPTPPTESNAAAVTSVRVECGQASDPGRDPSKQVNEDSAGFATTRHGELFVVCDGMGGHTGGQQASEIAIRTIFEMAGRVGATEAPRQVLQDAIEEAGRRVYQLGGPPSNLFRPGSTCVALLLRGDRAETAHVGDSRAYAVRGGRIFRLTRDHSLVQELIDSGALSEDQAIGHPDANKITRALGMTPEVDVELRSDPLEVFAGDVFVLATDGLTDLVSQEQILAVVGERLEPSGPQACADELVRLANEAGGHDNITVQVVHVKATGPRRANTLAQGPDGRAAADGRGANDPPETARIDAPSFTTAPDTIPDDVRPTIVETPAAAARASSPPPAGAHATEPEGPHFAASNAAPHRVSSRPPPAPVAPTEPGVPAKLEAGPSDASVSAAPGRPPPTVVDPSLAASPVVSPVPQAHAPPHGFDDGEVGDADGGNHPLLYVIVAVAVIVGVLLAVLLWSTFGG